MNIEGSIEAIVNYQKNLGRTSPISKEEHAKIEAKLKDHKKWVTRLYRITTLYGNND